MAGTFKKILLVKNLKTHYKGTHPEDQIILSGELLENASATLKYLVNYCSSPFQKRIHDKHYKAFFRELNRENLK